MDEQKTTLFWVFAVVIALLLGVVGGWWYGNKLGYIKGKVEAQAEAVKKAAEAANPFNQIPTNPLGSLKLNPFK